MKSSDRILAQRYARAFDALSQDAAQAARQSAELCACARALGQAEAYMADPAVPAAQKMAFTAQLFGEQSVCTHFVRVLLEAKRYYLLCACAQEAARLSDVRQGLVRADVQTAFALGETQQKRVEAALSRFSGKKAVARFSVRPELLGGVLARMDDVLIDGTLKGRFEKLQKELTK